MFNIALYEPEIPPNTGNIIRLAANAGMRLHLIKPYGFELDDKRVQRAGLDYHEWVNVTQYDNFSVFMQAMQGRRLFAFSTHGKALYTSVAYQPEDIFLFGPETRGLPKSLLQELPIGHILRIPMLPESRSLNLANSVAVVVYEAWRQHQFKGGH